jgi:acetoin utilization deacetylase AcuC-like enzyme
VKVTAFVSHFDCSRHDTGWGHLEHQGRLPAITRAVYAEMLDLFEPLLNVQGRRATEMELRLAHSSGYLEQVQGWVAAADTNGRPMEVAPGLMVSGATWDASVAAVGCALSGIDGVASGQARNAFCAVRPPARDAARDAPGRFGFLNAPAAAVRYLLERELAQQVLMVEWGDAPTSAALLQDENVRVVTIAELPADAGDNLFVDLLQNALVAAVESFPPDFVILSSGFDWLSGDPVGGREVGPRAFYEATVAVRELAEDHCGGRLVSILEGGYESRGTAAAVVQHLRALAFLPAAH